MIMFKPEVAPSDICKISPYLRILVSYLEAYVIENEVNDGNLTITSIMSDVVENRISKTHEEGRGCDVSLRGINEFHQQRIKFHLNNMYGRQWGTMPIGQSRIAPRVALIHGKGDNVHLHLQVRKDINLNMTEV